MAAIVTDTTDAQYVDPKHGVFGGVLSATDTYESDGTRLKTQGSNLEVYAVNAVATTQTLNFGPGIVACAWQASDVDAHRASCFVSDQAAGTITFSENETGTIEGWVWILRGGGG